jgi:hypothetical protein
LEDAQGGDGREVEGLAEVVEEVAGFGLEIREFFDENAVHGATVLGEAPNARIPCGEGKRNGGSGERREAGD